jgi:hypothetical protein
VIFMANPCNSLIPFLMLKRFYIPARPREDASRLLQNPDLFRIVWGSYSFR